MDAVGESSLAPTNLAYKMNQALTCLLVASLTGCTGQEQVWVKPETRVLGCEDYQSIPTDIGVLYNNVWNENAAGDYNWQQCLEQKPGIDPFIYGWSWDWPRISRHIFAYPQIKLGSSPWDPLPKMDARFPIKIEQLEKMVISHDLSINAVGDYNVATSMWLTHSPNIGDKPNKSIIAAEIMFWTFETQGHMAPAGRQIGSVVQDEQEWIVWLSENWGDASGENENSWVYLTFQATNPKLVNSFDASLLLNHPLVSDLDLNRYYIADVELGTEIMQGSGLVWVNDFSVDIEEKDKP